MRYDYGAVPATPEEWREAFDHAPGCHHPAPPIPVVDSALIDEIDAVMEGDEDGDAA